MGGTTHKPKGSRYSTGGTSTKIKIDEEQNPLVLALLLGVSGVGPDLLVVLLERGEILASLGELTLLHTLTDVPVNEGTLRVHEVELVVEAVPRGSDGGGARVNSV